MNSLTFETSVRADHYVHLPDELPIGLRIRVHIEPLDEISGIEDVRPQSDIRRLALAARQAYIASGGKLLNADEISAEVRLRRGGVSDE